MTKLSIKKRLYSIVESSAYLGISKRSVYSLIWSGSLPTVRIGAGGKHLIDINDLDKLINQSKSVEGVI